MDLTAGASSSPVAVESGSRNLGDGLAANPMGSAITYSHWIASCSPSKTAMPLGWAGMDCGAAWSCSVRRQLAVVCYVNPVRLLI